MKRLTATVIGAFAFLIFLISPAHALKAIVATIALGEVQVIGFQASPNASISWEGKVVTKSNKLGLFQFSTTDLPQDCVGTLSDGVTTIQVVVSGCTTKQVIGGVFKTGQTLSLVPGDDGDLQLGVPWPSPRFSKNGNGTVTDKLTGLVWLQNANCFGYILWDEAITAANGLKDGDCGLTDGSVAGDWRLPNVRELQSLIDYKFYAPPLPNAAGTSQWTEGDPFSNVFIDYSGPYWSSTRVAQTSNAWTIEMFLGEITIAPMDDSLFVWPVRGGR